MKDKHMYLNAKIIAEITKGRWINLKEDDLNFHGIRVNINRLEKNDICFTSRPDQWGKNIPLTEDKLEEIFQKGAIAVVTTNEMSAPSIDKPILLVENSKTALEQIAFYARDNRHVKRVLVTGTEGKTGFKNQLYQLLDFQTQVHANLDSSNLNVPILCSMASIRGQDKVEIIEASVANRGAGTIRSNLVKPDICVITEVGNEHVSTHGSFENLVMEKASITDGLKSNGVCILNADSKNYDVVREAIYQRKYVDILTFGSGKKCNARLISSDFDIEKLLWHVSAKIENINIQYVLPMISEHAPLSSLAPLLVLHLLGYDVRKAARDYIFFKSFETMGKLSEISIEGGSFRFYDHSHRASTLSYESALKDFSRLSPNKGGRKIAIIGNMLNIGLISKYAHERLAPLIEAAGINRLYTVGKFAKPIHGKLRNKSILILHGERYEEIENDFLNDIQNGDIVLIKGHHRIWLKNLAQKLYAMGESHEIR